VHRRYIRKLTRLENGDWRFGFSLWLLVAISLTGFLLEGVLAENAHPFEIG
jgi:hypothetical protein